MKINILLGLSIITMMALSMITASDSLANIPYYGGRYLQ